MRVRRPWLAGVAVFAALVLVALAYRPAKSRLMSQPRRCDKPPQSLLQAITSALQARNFPLAQENNLGMRLDTAGTMVEGAFITRAKSWLGIYSLGEYTASLGIPLITTEAPWTLPSMKDRIQGLSIGLLDAFHRNGSR